MLNQGRLVYSVWQEKLCYTATYCKLGEWQITVTLFNSFTAVTCLIIERFFNSLGLLIYHIGCTSRFSQSLWLILKQSYSLNCVYNYFMGLHNYTACLQKVVPLPTHHFVFQNIVIVSVNWLLSSEWKLSTLCEPYWSKCLHVFFGRQSLKSLLNTNVLSVLTVLS